MRINHYCLALLGIMLLAGGAQPAQAGDKRGDLLDTFDLEHKDSWSISSDWSGGRHMGESRYMDGATCAVPWTSPRGSMLSWLEDDSDSGRFLAAVQAAGLDSKFDGAARWTVFVPTDAAFAALPAGVVDELFLPENRPLLAQVVNYHIVRGDEPLSGYTTAQNVRFGNGDEWPIVADGWHYKLGEAEVVQADVLADNGRINVIDTVLLPMDVIENLETDGYQLAAWYPQAGHGVVMGSSARRENGTTTYDMHGDTGPSYNGKRSQLDRAGDDAKYQRGDDFYGYDKNRSDRDKDDYDNNYDNDADDNDSGGIFGKCGG